MVKFKANESLRGDYGPNLTTVTVRRGQIFEVPEFLAKKLELLEAKGIIERYIERPARKAYTVYENKAIVPAENKSVSGRRRR